MRYKAEEEWSLLGLGKRAEKDIPWLPMSVSSSMAPPTQGPYDIF